MGPIIEATGGRAVGGAGVGRRYPRRPRRPHRRAPPPRGITAPGDAAAGTPRAGPRLADRAPTATILTGWRTATARGMATCMDAEVAVRARRRRAVAARAPAAAPRAAAEAAGPAPPAARPPRPHRSPPSRSRFRGARRWWGMAC